MAPRESIASQQGQQNGRSPKKMTWAITTPGRTQPPLAQVRSGVTTVSLTLPRSMDERYTRWNGIVKPVICATMRALVLTVPSMVRIVTTSVPGKGTIG